MSIDPKTLTLKILEPPATKMAMPRPQDPDGEMNAESDRLQYDPHLHEEKRRVDTGQTSSPRITSTAEDGKTVVADVIAQLLNEGDTPDGLRIVRPIGNGIVTGTAVVEKIEDLRPKVKSIKAARELFLDLYHSVPATHCDPESLEDLKKGVPDFPGLDGSGVLIGIVDFGCDFRHRNFRHPSGATRIRYFWDQSVDSDPPLADYGYGREFTADAINQALSAGDDVAYQNLKYIPAAGAHGTHVMDIAAGNGRELARFGGKDGPTPAQPSHPGIAPNAQIIFVNLKTVEGGDLGNSRHLLEAVDYIFRKADELKMPAVVNLSVSTTGGPHDGKTLVEQGFAALVAKPGRAIVTSAGNTYQKQDHLSFTITPGNDRTILWYTDPRNTDPVKTKNEMEIWYCGKRELEVILCTPGDTELGSVPLGATADLLDEKQLRVGRVSHRYYDPSNEDNQIDIRLPHSDKPWKIKLVAKPLPTEAESTTKRSDKKKSESEKKDPGIEIHAWIEQDDHGLSRFDGETDPFYTLSSISCSDATLTVGAFDTADDASLTPPFEASSAGPTRKVSLAEKAVKEKRDKPDLSAPGVRIVAARAQGGVTSLSGTSMAAAHVTGLVALIFQLALRSGKGLLSLSEIRELLLVKDDAKKKERGVDELEETPFFPDLQAQLGAGRINGQKCMKEVLNLNPGAIAIELHRDPDPAPPDAQGLPENPEEYKKTIELLKGLKIHANNGAGNLKSLVAFIQQQTESGKGVRLSVEPLD